jgi:hypothetical protein
VLFAEEIVSWIYHCKVPDIDRFPRSSLCRLFAKLQPRCSMRWTNGRRVVGAFQSSGAFASSSIAA